VGNAKLQATRRSDALLADPTGGLGVDDRLWSTAETAEYLGLPEKTLHEWTYKGAVDSAGSPPPRSYKVGRHRRYKPAEVVAWLETRASGQKGGARATA